MTRGHNIVADGWAAAATPHPHPMPHPTPFPTQTHTQKASETLVFPLFDSWSWTNGPTDRRTDGRTKPLIELSATKNTAVTLTLSKMDET